MKICITHCRLFCTCIVYSSVSWPIFSAFWLVFRKLSQNQSIERLRNCTGSYCPTKFTHDLSCSSKRTTRFLQYSLQVLNTISLVEIKSSTASASWYTNECQVSCWGSERASKPCSEPCAACQREPGEQTFSWSELHIYSSSQPIKIVI